MAALIVVDDEAQVREMLADYLALAGHAVRVAADGAALRRLVVEAPADLVLLDVGLPGEDGYRLARWLREHHDPGIVMLTGADTVTDRVVGLEVGADDHVGKPFDPAELRARIDAVLRRRRPRSKGDAGSDLLPFGPYRFDTRRFRLLDHRGDEMPLSTMELDLIAAFATHPGQVLAREDLMRLAPPRGEDSFDRSIDNRVTRLRKKLERDPAKPEIIKTWRGAGYLFPG